MKRCKNVKNYTAMFKPQCHNGLGCDACWAIYRKRHDKPAMPEVLGNYVDATMRMRQEQLAVLTTIAEHLASIDARMSMIMSYQTRNVGMRR